MVSGSLDVTATGAAADAVGRHVPRLVAEEVAGRLFARDATLWGPRAEPVARHRLGWVRLPQGSRHLLGQVSALRAELRDAGLDRVLLCGMGGATMGAETLCRAHGTPLAVLDSTDPHQVRAALRDLERTVVVVASKSGTTLETDSHRRAAEQSLREAGRDPADHLVVVTDAGSPLDAAARAAGYRVVHGHPDVGGRFSALTAFGLVPAGLAGVDLEGLLDEADAVADLLALDDDGNPGLRLAAALAGTEPLRDVPVLVPDGPGAAALADWVEQLLAESTGKDGGGLLPVVVSAEEDPEVKSQPRDALLVRLAGEGADLDEDGPPGEAAVRVGGGVGSQLLLWQVAVAVAGRLLAVNPFDEPEVAAAKSAVPSLLARRAGHEPAAFTDGAVEVRGGDWLGSARSVSAALSALLDLLDCRRGYVVVTVYLDRSAHADLVSLRRALSRRSGRPVSLGWGPRALHSTRQAHQGGRNDGVHLLVTGSPQRDLPVPGRPYSFGDLVHAQALADTHALEAAGRPVLRLHLTDITAGLPALREALA